MLKNYFKIALRNILKQKFYSFINVAGLSIGIASCLLIILYVNHELSYDRFHKDADRIYRVDLHGKIANQEIFTATTCAPMAQALENEVPEVENATRILQDDQYVMRYNDKVFTEDNIIYADSNFFDFFSFPLVEGQAKTALSRPRNIVLTEEMAEKYFGNISALGKMIAIGDEAHQVTAVVETPPYNSHFRFDFLISASTLDFLNNGIWLNNNLYTYFKLQENASIDNIQEKLDGLVEKYIGPEMEQFMGVSLAQMREQGGTYGYYLTKMTDIHLRSDSRDQMEPSGEMVYIYIFITIAGFIILIACINFMNLSTARSASRAKEVGLRKTLGSVRSNLIIQFLIESLLFSLVATLLAYLIVYQVLPLFNFITGKPLSTDLIVSPAFVGLGLLIIVLVGILAGSYPAFYLTSFDVVDVLKGKVREGMKGGKIRSILVVLQFSISIFLFICTGIIYHQLQYFSDKNLGMDKNNVVILNNAGLLDQSRKAFKNSLEQESNIAAASYTTNVVPGINNTTLFRKPGSASDHMMGRYYADNDHRDVLDFKIKSGRFFSKEFPSDSSAAVINEAAAREFGWKEPVGEEFITFRDNGMEQRVKIIGVVKDFNYESLKSQIRPLIMQFTPEADKMMIRYKGGPQEAIATIKKHWETVGPDEPFEYEFLDQSFDSLFRAEQRIGYIFSLFTGLAIFIACLGLMGLSAFTAEKRTKEISIRKILGASDGSVLVMLNKEFTRLVLFSFIVAAPVAWWIMEKWLQDFAFRIAIAPWIFIAAGILTLVIAWITVSWQSYKAAISNPVDSLKSE